MTMLLLLWLFSRLAEAPAFASGVDGGAASIELLLLLDSTVMPGDVGMDSCCAAMLIMLLLQ